MKELLILAIITVVDGLLAYWGLWLLIKGLDSVEMGRGKASFSDFGMLVVGATMFTLGVPAALLYMVASKAWDDLMDPSPIRGRWG